MMAGRPPTSFHAKISKYSARYKIGVRENHARVSEEERKARQAESSTVTEEYYAFIDDRFEKGWSTRYHYTPFAPNESLEQALSFFEHRFAFMIGLKPGMKVLDIGCGIGAPAREIAKFIGCEIVGVSIAQLHIDRAIELTAREGLSHLCTFVKADFLNLPFAPHSFDAAYAIEACVHAPEYAQVYAEVSCILKLGAPFGVSEWVLTENFNATNTKHVRIRNEIERGNEVSNIDKISVAKAGLISSGFEIVHEEDYAEHWFSTLRCPNSTMEKSTSTASTSRFPTSPVLVPFVDGHKPADPPTRSCAISTTHPSQAPRPWYFLLKAQSALAATSTDRWIAIRMKPATRKVAYGVVWVLEKVLRVYPKGTCESMDTMGLCVDSVAEGAAEGVFSPCWWFICRKALVEEPRVQ